MIRTRIIVGALLALGAGGVLFGDTWLAREGFAWFPFLFALLMLAGFLGARELVRLFPAPTRPTERLVAPGVLLLVVANWHRVLARPTDGTWALIAGVFAGLVLVAFLAEMRRYAGETGVVVHRLALATFALAYLGVLTCFFVQTRLLSSDPAEGAVMLALLIFVPKCTDIGAFFTGTFLGRHKMTPALSPKKTWEGFAGGMLAGAAVAVGLDAACPVFAHGAAEAVAFGLVIGAFGTLGDLAESLIKRDCRTKDASQTIPGFGGVLDVIDSVLFAAPVAYLWFRLTLQARW